MFVNIKLPNAFVMLVFIMAFVAILTYILPAGSYSLETADGVILSPADVLESGAKGTPIPDTYEKLPSRPQGFWHVITAPVAGIKDAIEISLFILMVGGLIGVVMKSGAIDVGIGSLIKCMQGRESSLIMILTFLFSLGGTTYGMCEETIAFYPLLLPVMIKAGYDPLVVMGVIMGGSATGCLASTVNPFSVGISAGFADISLGYGLGMRVGVWILLTLIMGLFISFYAKRVLKQPERSLVHKLQIKYPFMEQAVLSNGLNERLSMRQAVVLTLFSLSFIFMTFSVIPFKDLGLSIIPTLGWWFSELSTLFLVSAILCGIASGMKQNEFIDSLISGMNEVLSVALVVGVARGIVILMNNGFITATILNWGVGIVKPLGGVFFINALYFLNMILGFFVTSTSALATLTMPIFAPLADFVSVDKAFIINAFSWGVGVINMIAPSSGVVMGALMLCKLPYDKWLKFIFPIVLINIVFAIILLSLGVLISK